MQKISFSKSREYVASKIEDQCPWIVVVAGLSSAGLLLCFVHAGLLIASRRFTYLFRCGLSSYIGFRIAVLAILNLYLTVFIVPIHPFSLYVTYIYIYIYISLPMCYYKMIDAWIIMKKNAKNYIFIS